MRLVVITMAVLGSGMLVMGLGLLETRKLHDARREDAQAAESRFAAAVHERAAEPRPSPVRRDAPRTPAARIARLTGGYAADPHGTARALAAFASPEAARALADLRRGETDAGRRGALIGALAGFEAGRAVLEGIAADPADPDRALARRHLDGPPAVR